MLLTFQLKTTADAQKVFDYLSDFTTTTEWDPGSVRTTRSSGDGGVGTTYANRSSFGGRESELTYTVVARDARSITFQGENKSVTAVDIIGVDDTQSPSVVTYTADFTFKGASRLLAPFLGPAFRKLRHEAEEGLRAALTRMEN